MKYLFIILILLLSVAPVNAQFGDVDTSATLVDTSATDTMAAKVDTVILDSAALARLAKYKAAKDSADKEIIYEGAQHSAEFPGGGPAFRYFIEKNMIYPPAAKANKIEGKVFVSFVVDKKGVIKHVTLHKGLGYGCDEEAIRLAKKMPKWQPGIWYDDNPIHTRVTMSIPFVLPKE